ncbi:uncharacterized protein PODANS_4_6405 [Podospora anserina S mat+]|uniref:Podospora anserina S mat+ genomic DNA chromosome 4, supercontig 4 n=1 Tax=Podospora anserina (strain S / ATCC MYA-4624 / DSM 980 / FGSC 10383) TaxID=515849 RepID=B2ART9_PODAN|nr:uncharacterized protein PODANS_4_6405 [Podospora anserina S mat+]CAP66867.1 unnamed protein product [Podospora anserina S mat+]CDP28609.1 Putative protein of unknown function [Podospora anserina S mat+]
MGSSISPAAIADTVIGGIAALGLGLALVLWLHRKSQRDRKAAALPEPRPQEPPASVFNHTSTALSPAQAMIPKETVPPATSSGNTPNITPSPAAQITQP